MFLQAFLKNIQATETIVQTTSSRGTSKSQVTMEQSFQQFQSSIFRVFMKQNILPATIAKLNGILFKEFIITAGLNTILLKKKSKHKY
jgi:hypothetical protein